LSFGHHSCASGAHGGGKTFILARNGCLANAQKHMLRKMAKRLRFLIVREMQSKSADTESHKMQPEKDAA
jgi:hypothetical protein